MIRAFAGKYRFLSNFHPAKVEYEGKTYRTVEHAYQAAKTMVEGIREFVRLQPSPGCARLKGREIHLREDWEKIKLGIMEELVRKKFLHPKLMARLLETGDQELVEGNWWRDTFWGVCRGVGHNHLGKILMRIRGELREEREDNGGNNASKQGV